MIINAYGLANPLISNPLSCQQTDQYFFPNREYNMLKPIFDALASSDNPDVVAMSGYVNGIKGQFFSDTRGSRLSLYTNNRDWLIPPNGVGWAWISTTPDVKSARDALFQMIGHFETTLYGVLEMNADGMQYLMDKTNNRIYAALLVYVNIIWHGLVANNLQPKSRRYDHAKRGRIVW